MRNSLKKDLYSFTVLPLVLAFVWSSSAHAVAVVCPGQSIQTQLDLGNDVEFSGTCVEDIFIAGRHLDIDGIDEASGIIQGEVVVHGASRVSLKNLIVRNPPGGDGGVFFVEGANVDIVNSTFDNLNGGFCVSRNAFADIDDLTSTTQTAPTSDACTNITVLSNAGIRIKNSTITNDLDITDGLGGPVYALRNSLISLRGGNSITNNGDEAALGIYGDSHGLEDNAGTSTANTINGAAIGVDVWNGSSLDTRQAVVTAPDNYVGLNSTLHVGSDSFGGPPANIIFTGDVTAFQQSTMDINTAANMNGTVSCFGHSTLGDHNLGGTGTVDCSYRLETEADNAIHVKSSNDTTALIKVETDGNAALGNQVGFQFINGGPGGIGQHQWDVRPGGVGNLIFNYSGGPSEFTYTTVGNLLIAGTLTQGSSRTVKHDIREVDSRKMLEKVLSIPISEWSYKHDASNDVRHLGPMAEDFAHVFGLGSTDKGISSLDTSGVALAAIQGLGQKLAEKDKEIAALKKEKDIEVTALKEELTQLWGLVNRLVVSDQLAVVN